jgi:hypothetical protein
MRTRFITLVVCILAVSAATIQGLAQGPQQEQRREAPPVVINGVGPQMVQAQVGGDGYVFVASEMSFDRKLVKGAPYSAVAVTESIQTLADGNRLVHKSSASIYRDSEGRTRRDQVLAKIGPYASAGDTPQTIFINDPVAQVNYILEPASRIARKVNMPSMPNAVMRRTPDTLVEDKIRARDSQQPGALTPGDRERIEFTMQTSGIGAGAAGGMSIAINQGGKKWNPIKESLGKQMIEGVEAEGTRVTITIPAGDVGNDQAINIVSENWVSPDLQAVVMSRHSDPRSGETVYKLTNINRSEPAHSLFEVPADYSIKEQPNGEMKMRFEKQVQQKKDEK